MNVSVGLECSGMSRTLRPLESSVYSEMPPRVLTKVKPSVLAGTTAGSAARSAGHGSNVASRNERRRFIERKMRGGVNSGGELPTSNIQLPTSNIQLPTSNIRHPTLNAEC